MKPIKNFESISKWMLRIFLFLFILSYYYDIIMTWNFKDVFYLINVLYVVFAAFIVIGGFQRASTLTIVSSIVVSSLSFYKAYSVFSGSFLSTSFYTFLLLGAVSLFFVSKGNN